MFIFLLLSFACGSKILNSIKNNIWFTEGEAKEKAKEIMAREWGEFTPDMYGLNWNDETSRDNTTLHMAALKAKSALVFNEWVNECWQAIESFQLGERDDCLYEVDKTANGLEKIGIGYHERITKDEAKMKSCVLMKDLLRGIGTKEDAMRKIDQIATVLNDVVVYITLKTFHIRVVERRENVTAIFPDLFTKNQMEDLWTILTTIEAFGIKRGASTWQTIEDVGREYIRLLREMQQDVQNEYGGLRLADDKTFVPSSMKNLKDNAEAIWKSEFLLLNIPATFEDHEKAHAAHGGKAKSCFRCCGKYNKIEQNDQNILD